MATGRNKANSEAYAAWNALPQNNIAASTDGIRRANPGTTIYDQLFSSMLQEFSRNDPDGGIEQYGFTNPFTAPNGQTYYSGTDMPGSTALNMAQQYGSEPLWVDAQGNYTLNFLDDNGQMMTRMPGWGQGSFNDPRYGEYVPYDQYNAWAMNQGGDFLDKLGSYGPLIAMSMLGAGPLAASMGAGGVGATAAEGGGVGAGGGLSGAQAFPLAGDGFHTIAPLAADGTVGTAVTAGEGFLGGIGAAGSGGPLLPNGPVSGGMTMVPSFPGMTPLVTGATEYALPPTTGLEEVMAGGGGGFAGVLPSVGIPGSPGSPGASGSSGAGPAAGIGSVLSNLLGGGGTLSDLTKLLGTLGATGLGVFGAKEQADAMREMQDKQLAAHQLAQDKQLGLNRETRDMFLGLGAPYRDRLNSSYQPGFDIFQADPALQGAVDQTSNSLLRKLSTSGNPFDNPGGLMEAQKYVNQNVALPQLNTYRSQLGTFGQLGTGTAGQAGLNSASQVNSGANFIQPQSNSGIYDALGYGLSQLTNPTPDINSLLQQMNSMKLGSWGQ
jgi:hypothetical protein